MEELRTETSDIELELGLSIGRSCKIQARGEDIKEHAITNKRKQEYYPAVRPLKVRLKDDYDDDDEDVITKNFIEGVGSGGENDDSDGTAGNCKKAEVVNSDDVEQSSASISSAASYVDGSTDGKQSSKRDPMHYVSTKGNGPNGRKVDGILVRYTRNEVCILCVCHGFTFSPAGFVLHAGGVDVANALRQIRVTIRT